MTTRGAILGSLLWKDQRRRYCPLCSGIAKVMRRRPVPGFASVADGLFGGPYTTFEYCVRDEALPLFVREKGHYELSAVLECPVCESRWLADRLICDYHNIKRAMT